MTQKSSLRRAALLAALIAIPTSSFAVTLGSTTKTPCFFGSGPQKDSCMAKQSSPSSTGSFGPAQNTPETPIIAPSLPKSPVSAVVSPAPTVTVAPPSPAVQTVPLPLGGLLLLGSLGVMVAANRKKR